jgi:hypothetical protein
MWESIFRSVFHGMRERDALLLVAAAGAAIFAGTISAWLGAHFGARRAVKRAFRDRIEIPTIVTEVRYDELARSIDAIAVEVERISEAQRFTARLLAERANTSVSAPVVNAATVSAASMPRREPGITTPH